MSKRYADAVARRSFGQLLINQGFSDAEDGALELLTETASWFVEAVGATAQRRAHIEGRGSVNLADLHNAISEIWKLLGPSVGGEPSGEALFDFGAEALAVVEDVPDFPVARPPRKEEEDDELDDLVPPLGEEAAQASSAAANSAEAAKQSEALLQDERSAAAEALMQLTEPAQDSSSIQDKPRPTVWQLGDPSVAAMPSNRGLLSFSMGKTEATSYEQRTAAARTEQQVPQEAPAVQRQMLAHVELKTSAVPAETLPLASANGHEQRIAASFAEHQLFAASVAEQQLFATSVAEQQLFAQVEREPMEMPAETLLATSPDERIAASDTEPFIPTDALVDHAPSAHMQLKPMAMPVAISHLQSMVFAGTERPRAELPTPLTVPAHGDPRTRALEPSPVPSAASRDPSDTPARQERYAVSDALRQPIEPEPAQPAIRLAPRPRGRPADDYVEERASSSRAAKAQWAAREVADDPGPVNLVPRPRTRGSKHRSTDEALGTRAASPTDKAKRAGSPEQGDKSRRRATKRIKLV